MKRILSFLIAALVVFGLVSCAAEEEIVPEYYSSSEEAAVDLKGQVIKMSFGALKYFEGENSTLTFTKNTDLGDLALKRVRDVESKYNCKFDFIFKDGCGEIAYNNAVAGSYIYDIVSDESFFLISYMRASAFTDLIGLENLDVFDEYKWGNKYMRMSTMWDGHIFGLLPAALPLRLGISINDLVVNEDQIVQINETDPRDYYENGQWNWDTFGYCIENYAHANQMTNEPVTSLSSGFGGFSRELAMSNGLEFFYLNDDDTFRLGYFTPQAIDAYNQAFEWFYGATADNVYSTGSWDDMMRRVINGETVLGYISGWQLLSTTDSLAYHMENFGLLPFPVGPNAKSQNDYTTSYSSANFTICIPITAKDPEISALLLDKLYDPFDGLDTEEAMLDYLQKNYFSDRRDAQFYLDMTRDDHVYYHDHLHGMSTMFDQFPGNGIAKGVSSYEAAHYEAAEKYILSAYKTLLENADRFHK